MLLLLAFILSTRDGIAVPVLELYNVTPVCVI